MLRTLLLSLIVVGAAVGVAVGAVTALADKGGPGHGVDHGVATGLQGDGGSNVVQTEDNDNGNDGEGAQHIAQVIAETFGGVLTAEADGVSQEGVLALHDQGIGFGAIFKLYLLAAAGDATAAEILSTGEVPEDGFAFGERFKEMADQVSELSAGEDGVPKNLGQAKKGSQVTALGADDDGDQGPPDHAPAHGWRR